MPSLKESLAIDVTTMNLVLSTKAKRTALTIEELVKMVLENGGDERGVKDALIQDLEEGGRIFGELRNALRATSNGIINRVRDSAQFSIEEDGQKYRWIAVMINTCPDCLERHGKSKLWEDWVAEGLPRTGHTVCKENCKCVLVLSDITEISPVIRKKK